MYIRNSKVKGTDDREGSVAKVFQKMGDIIETNDGTRSFEWVTDTCHDQQAPFQYNQETRIALTSTQHLISDFSKGFLTVKAQAGFKLQGIIPANFNDSNHLIKLFVGWKSSNQAIRQIQIWVNGHSIGYNQQEAIREGFAYSSCMTKQEKATKRFIHSLYENVSKYAKSICGVYINVDDFKDGQEHIVEWTANIPFDNFLVLQAFELFPNFAIPNVELRLYFDPSGLVWCPVDPYAVYDVKTLIEGATGLKTLPTNIDFKRGFTQIGNSATCPSSFNIDISDVSANTSAIDGYSDMSADEKAAAELAQRYSLSTKYSVSSSELTLFCQSMRINEFSSHMAGFGVCEQSLKEIVEVLSQGLVIPSQILIYDGFPDAANVRGIQTNLRATLSNVTSLSIVFPKHANDLTVFENPVYEGLQLRINNKNYPDKTLSTVGAEFLQMQLIASDLDGPIECTKEFEDSYCLDRNASDGTRYTNTLSDCSSFLWNVQLERNGGGYFFDGYESHGANIPIELVGKPVYSGEQDTYYNVNSAGTIHPPSPQCWSCKDTFILLTNGDMKFVINGEPQIKQTQRDPKQLPPTNQL